MTRPMKNNNKNTFFNIGLFLVMERQVVHADVKRGIFKKNIELLFVNNGITIRKAGKTAKLLRPCNTPIQKRI